MTALPCPFCGRSAIRLMRSDREGNPYEAWCGYCGASGPVADDKAEAWRLWNHRPPAPPQEKG